MLEVGKRHTLRAALLLTPFFFFILSSYVPTYFFSTAHRVQWSPAGWEPPVYSCVTVRQYNMSPAEALMYFFFFWVLFWLFCPYTALLLIPWLSRFLLKLSTALPSCSLQLLRFVFKKRFQSA